MTIVNINDLKRFDFTPECKTCKYRTELGLFEYCCSFVIDEIRKQRFDLMKKDNPHLINTYAKVYNRVNNMFENEVKNFAEDVIRKVNETSEEPLLDVNGNYTEYGEYVMDLLNTYGLKDFIYSYPNQLSGGMRQRVG